MVSENVVCVRDASEGSTSSEELIRKMRAGQEKALRAQAVVERYMPTLLEFSEALAREDLRDVRELHINLGFHRLTISG